jgi:heat shock protein HslJ
MSKLYIVAFVAFVLLFAGCASQTSQKPVSTSSPQPAAPTAPAGTPAHLTNCGYSGTWNTDWGTMQLSQTGNKVSGTYTHDSGMINGTISDGVFVGRWSESPSYAEPDDAGDAMFYFGKDCNSFSGNWRYGTGAAGAAWDGTWFGTKLS